MTNVPPLPATGAWLPGDEPGHRQFFTFATDRRFALDCGVMLSDVVVAYETWGRLDADAANAVLVCHAWTGDSHAAGLPGVVTPRPDGGTTRSGRASRSTPTSTSSCAPTCSAAARVRPAPPRRIRATGRPYGSRFPVVTIRDMVRAQSRLAEHLGVDQWLSVIGGSMGGMQALEWAVMYPRRVRSLVAIATCMQATAQQIAWGAIGRRAIRLDPTWRGGDYYDAAPGDGPQRGPRGRPDGRPGDVPQRQRVHRPVRS